YYMPDLVAQVASTSVKYSFVLGGESRVGIAEPKQVIMKLPDVMFIGGAAISTSTKNRENGDNFAGSFWWIEEWIEE
ncbi:unnamed protein product, partial [marine sediment metagenome]